MHAFPSFRSDRAQRMRWLAGTAIALLAPGAALADPLDVSTALTNPVATNSASNNSPGDVTVETAGSIIVSTAGPALTVNSSNAVTNGGSIESSAISGATALLIDGTNPITTTLTNNGTIAITGTGGSGNYGVRLMNGPVSGTIASGTASAVTVQGDSSIGVSIESMFTGNVTLNSVSAPGQGSTAISITAPLVGNLGLTGATSAAGSGGTALFIGNSVSGSVDNTGSLTSGAAAATTATGNGASTTTTGAAIGGSAVARIAGSIGGGFVNDFYYTDSTGAVVPPASATSADTIVRGALTGNAGTPALLVEPDTTNPANITIGMFGAAGTADGYGIINRGAITTSGANTGVAGTAVSITGATFNGNAYTTSVAGGFANQSGSSVQSSAIDAAATAIDIGAGATVPAIVNAGTIGATVTNANSGGAAYGVKIESGANVTSIVNSGGINAGASGTGFAAYGILDTAGTVTSVTNSGTIGVTAATGAIARAIDLSAGTGAQTIVNSGQISGDIAFGSGPATYSSTSGSLAGTLAYGSGAGQLILAGTSDFANPVTLGSGGTLAVSLADTARLRFTGTAPTLASLAASGQSILSLDVTGATPALAITGAASFTGQSTVDLDILKPVGSTQITVLTAAGGITTDHATSLLTTSSAPFLYTVTGYDVTATDIVVTLHQKSAAEIGFVPGVAPLFDQSLSALAAGGAAFQAVASLPDQKSVLAAYRQIEPPTYGSGPLRVAESLQNAGTGAVSARLDSLIVDPPAGGGRDTHWGVWAQQAGEFLRHRDAEDDPGFQSNGFILAFGGDYALSSHLVAGIGFHFGWTNLSTDGATAINTSPLDIHSSMIDAYLGWHSGPFYVQAIGTAGKNNYRFLRRIGFGGLSDTQTAKWSGTQFGGSLTGGARLHFGRFLVQPSDSFTYFTLHQDSYTEAGADAFDLAVDSQKAHLAVNTAKLSLGYDFPMGDGALEVMGHGAYVSRLDRDVPDVHASFLAGGDAFTLIAQPLNRDELEEGFTLGYQQPDFYLALNGSRRQETGASDSSVSAVLRMNF